MENSRIELLRLKPMKAAYVYSLSQNPEEDALNRIADYAKTNGLTPNRPRLFGRNIYPTDQPEPHGYEYYLTVEDYVKAGWRNLSWRSAWRIVRCFRC